MQQAKVSGKELPGSNHNRLYLVILSVLFILTLPVQGAGQVSFSEIQALEYSAPNEVVPYGAGEHQFAEYWHPGTSEPALVILIHGGCWSNEYGLDHIRALASKLKGSGYAVWSTEYRRVGDVGGGWPGTFEDIADSLNYTDKLSNINQHAKFVMGHSAGGHLALWVAAAGHLPLESPLGKRMKTQIQGAIGLAPIADLAAYSLGDNSCEVVTEKLMGGSAIDLAERYALGSPSALLPSIDSILIHGEGDTIVNISQSQRYAASSSRASIIPLKGLGHFDMINPEGPVFDRIIEALVRLKPEATK
ncbi:alpha/beta hydrolase [Pseudomonadales bacterium]|nr:alpha/beta hydrolase [Pseudomonadales bacterium]MDC0994261.1 alpha/beta hydrolase [Pseudomonadales bacterium]MDG1000811.1 alpha/beta hydrolase [Pseudomonadales bacterium]